MSAERHSNPDDAARRASTPQTAIEVERLADRLRAQNAPLALGIGRADEWKPQAPVAWPPPPDVLLASHPSQPLGSVDELLDYEDEEFLHLAYHGVLHRDPDVGGFHYFAAQLRAGTSSKLAILAQLRESAEGRAVEQPVAGLDAALRWERWSHLPLVGVMFRAVSLVREQSMLRRRVRRLRRLRSDMYRVSKVMESTLHVFHATVDRLNMLQVSDVERRQNVRGLSEVVLAMRKAIAAVETSTAAGRDGVREVAQTAAQLRGGLDEAARRLQAIADEAAAHRAVTDETRTRTEVMGADLRIAGAQIADLTTGVHALAAETRGQLGAHDARIGEQDAKMRRILQELASSPSPGAQGAVRAHEAFVMADVYSAFEDRFRGSREEIRKRTSVYLPEARSPTVTKKTPLLDVGCGRGEWLELLRDEGIPARGIELNPSLAANCRDLGLDVAEGEAIHYLRRLEDGSLGAVTAMHVVEHMVLRDLVAFLDEIKRVLRPGGFALFETPDPQNLIVGAFAFWLDPSHQRPIPSQTLAFLVESRGFNSVEVRRLHPFPQNEATAPGEMPDRVAELLYGPRDYAVIARKEGA